MIEELYSIISIYIGGSIFFAFGLCLLFLSVDECPRLKNYLIARRIMASAYLFLALSNVAEYFSRSPDDNIQLTQVITLIIGCSQSFLFTYVFITLINPKFLSGKKVARLISLFLLFVTALFVIYSFCPTEWFKDLFAVYILIYTYLIVRITRLFLTHYRRYIFYIDNFYSGEETRHLNWVRVSFFAALAIGVMALLNALFMSAWGALLFSVVVIVFYIVFAIQFINYPVEFRHVETAITPDEDETPDDDEAQQPDSSIKIGSEAFALLEKRLELWAANKGFTEQGITIDRLAARLITNHKYLSTYINTYKQQTFRKWINELRIEEAKIIILQEPEITLTEIAHRTGYADKSHFLRHFREQTGVSPTEWRKLIQKQKFPVLTPEQP